MRLELAQRPFLIDAHEAAVPGNVACPYRSQPAVNTVFSHRDAPRLLPPFKYRGIAEGNNVRFGSLADICSATSHVRFTPNSGHSLAAPLRPNKVVNVLASEYDPNQFTVRHFAHALLPANIVACAQTEGKTARFNVVADGFK
jgi:hypothetical protein